MSHAVETPVTPNLPDSSSLSTPDPHSHKGQGSTWVLAVGAIGVVFGDIGTSPLYAFREALNLASSDGLVREEILGILSLMIWALILIVTVKYVLLLMRADNEGEGGVLALCALASRGQARIGGIVMVLGAIGAALFYGDAMITPALSVLSAVEGLRSIPSIGETLSQREILGISLAILIVLFAFQSRGTASVSKLFGPICIIWFLALAGLGMIHIADDPSVLVAFGPWHAASFIAHHGTLGLLVLGAVFLTVTGAEALTADMGHFGRQPIRLGWFFLVFPALTLNYLGQGAFALYQLAAAQAAGTPFINQDWFFVMIPDAVRLPMVMLATMATIIASQAVITGAYSLTQQAMQLGFLPRMRILQTSAGHSGQIYIGAINWMLLAGVIVLAVGFRTSSAMAAAYGIAVTGTMVVTCCLAYIVARRLWKLSVPQAALLIVPFLLVDLLFFGANAVRVVEGGWVPLSIGGGMLALILIWRRGMALVRELEGEGAVSLIDMARNLSRRSPARIEGLAVFLTADNTLTPHALLHNLKHNHVLHHHNYVVRVNTLRVPYADPAQRLKIEPVDANFTRIDLFYGFMDTPKVRDDLIDHKDQLHDIDKASYFIGRNNYVMSSEVGMPLWQDMLFLTLYRNATDPTEYYHIPHNRVIQLGAQHLI